MKTLAILLCFLALGCTAPRLFQQKVPAPIVKEEKQVEAERVAADLIAKKIEKPEELKPVAVSLSTSLGAPKKSLADVKEFDLPRAADKANEDLAAGILKMQKQLDLLNLRLAKLQGKEIEGTGFSILGPGVSMVVIGLIVLGVVFPPAFTLMGIAYRRLKQTTGIIVENIDKASKDEEAQVAMKKLKSEIGNKMDTLHKQVVHSLKKP